MIRHLLYIDPGSGSYLLQVIIGAVLGVAVYFKTILHKVKMFFGKGKKEQEPETPEEND
jgi:hypothetical protein